MAGEALYNGLADAGAALAKGIEKYQSNRQQSTALDGQLDRLAGEMAGYAQRHPDVVSPEDEPLIRSIAAASGQGLAQKKAALADAMLWLDAKRNEARQTAVADYQRTIADATQANQQFREKTATAAADQQRLDREAMADLARSLIGAPSDPDNPTRTPGYMPGLMSARPPDARSLLGGVISRNPGANVGDIISLVNAMSPTGQGAGKWNLQPGTSFPVGDKYTGVPTTPNSITVLKNANGDELTVPDLVRMQGNLTQRLNSFATDDAEKPAIRAQLAEVNRMISSMSGLNLGERPAGGPPPAASGVATRRAVWDPQKKKFVLSPASGK